MATNFPTSLDSLTNPTSSDTMEEVPHADQHADANDAIEALQAKVGVDSSAVATSLDYKISNASSEDPGHTHTLAAGATDVTSTAAEVNVLDGIPGTLTATELGYVDGVTSAIQTQIDTKIAADSSDTLTNKTIDADNNTISNLAHGAEVNNPSSGVHGVSGSVVGTSDTQELSNKTHDGDFALKNSTDNITVNSSDPYRTITLTPGFLKPTTTSGCAASTTVEAGTNDIDYDVLDFDASTDESAFANFQMPDSWDAGTIQFRFVWTNAGGGAGETATMGLSGRSYADSDAIDQAVGSVVNLSDVWLAQGDVHISAWSNNVTLAGTPAAGEWVHVEILRDVSEDTLTGDLRLIALQIRYRQAQFGD